MDLEERLKKIEKFIESLKNTNTFPKEVRDTLSSLGFLLADGFIDYTGGAGGNYFQNLFLKFLNQRKMIGIEAVPYVYVVNSVSANTCSFITPIENLVDLAGQSVALYTSGSFPGGLDTGMWLTIINPTSTTFQLSLDGVTAIDITSVGSGTQYISLV